MQYFCVSIPPAVRPTLLQQIDMGSLTAHTFGCAVHTKGVQAQASLHTSWLGGIEKMPLTLPRQGIEPKVFGFEFWLATHWATSPFLMRVSKETEKSVAKLARTEKSLKVNSASLASEFACHLGQVWYCYAILMDDEDAESMQWPCGLGFYKANYSSDSCSNSCSGSIMDEGDKSTCIDLLTLWNDGLL